MADLPDISQHAMSQEDCADWSTASSNDRSHLSVYSWSSAPSLPPSPPISKMGGGLHYRTSALSWSSWLGLSILTLWSLSHHCIIVLTVLVFCVMQLLLLTAPDLQTQSLSNIPSPNPFCHVISFLIVFPDSGAPFYKYYQTNKLNKMWGQMYFVIQFLE